MEPTNTLSTESGHQLNGNNGVTDNECHIGEANTTGGSNGNTGTNTSRRNRVKAKITSSSLLASNFVPKNLRAINSLNVSVVVPTTAPPSMEEDIERVFCGLVGDSYNDHFDYKDTLNCDGNANSNSNGNNTHVANNNKGSNSSYDHPAAAAKMEQYDNANKSSENHRSKYFYCHCQHRDDRCLDRAKKIKAVEEAAFAFDQAQRRLAEVTPASSNDGSNDDPIAATTIPSIAKDGLPRGMDDTAIPRHYIPIFRELLQVDQAERQRLYANNYNQYNLKVTSPASMSKRNGESLGTADLKILGIADGHPSIRPGDLVLVRPKVPILYDPSELSSYHEPNPSTPAPAHDLSENNSTVDNNPYSNYYMNKCNNTYPHPSYAQDIQRYPGYPVQQNILPPYYNPYPPQKLPQHHMLEISAHVLSVKRASRERKKSKDQVLISWLTDPELDARLRRQPCTVRFIPSSEMHERCLTALDWLRKLDPVVARDLLFPSRSPKLPPPPVLDESETTANSTEEREFEQLNRNQARFVQMVTSRTIYPTKERIRPPMILTGPAGTGKTKTLLAAILQILRVNPSVRANPETTSRDRDSYADGRHKPRILVCTPSHTACDVITQRLVSFLLESQSTPEIESDTERVRKMVFRLYDATRPVETVPVHILPYTRQRGYGGQFVLPDPQELLDFSVIVCTCQDAHLLFMAGLTNKSLRRRRECLMIDTKRRLQQAGMMLEGTIEGANKPHFTHLFIDEAAQATEPESLIPISVVVDDHPDATKVEIALCGDPRQLGPTLYAPKVSEGLQQSLLERLLRLPLDVYGGGRKHLMGPPTADARLTLEEMIEYSFQKVDYHQHLSVFLNLSYRGHPSFLYIPSKLFYFDKLRSVSKNVTNGIWIEAIRNIETLPTAKSAYPYLLQPKPMDWPILFHGVKGKCTSMVVKSYFGSNSWCNHAEADVVVEIIGKLLQTGILTASIGVMAAFRAQVVVLRNKLRNRNLGAVNVGMVEDFQSMERDVIILSLTRSNKELMQADVVSGVGLFYQPKRMNVALTRAQHALIVVGDPNLMKEDNAWAQWLEFCKQNGLWCGNTA